MTQRRFPVIEVAGSPEERGYQYGLAAQDRIGDAVQKTFRYLQATVNWPKERCLALNPTWLPYIKDFAPDLIEEMHGIAQGCGIPFEEIFFFNYFVDIQYQETSPQGCTTFSAFGPATTDGSVYIGQNGDYLAMYQDDMIILKVDLGGLRLAMVTYPGMVGESGLNSAGIGAVANGIMASDARVGVPFILIMRKILEQERIGDALSLVISAHRASGTNYVIGDRNGELFNLECSAQKYDVLYTLDGVRGHSNHFTSPRMQDLDLIHTLPFCGNSLMRQSRISKKLAENKGRINLEKMQEFSRDHVDYPRSLCSHLDETLPEIERIKTLFSVILQPDGGRMSVAAGNPCQHEFVEYEI